MRTHLIALLIGLVAVAVAPRPAAADPRTDAKAHYLKGKSLFDAKDYVNAIAEFKLADQLAPSAVNDYNVALAYDALGDAAQAIVFYDSYLKRMPDAANKAEVQASIKRLEAVRTSAADDEARRAEEERRRIEEERKMQPPDGGGNDPVTTSTGDPELDRVAGVDVNGVRDQRGMNTAGGAVATGGGPAAPPPPSGGGMPPPEQPKKAKPIYKQWWFWVVAGVSAYVLISILAADSSSQTGAINFDRPIAPMPDGFGSGGGASVLSF